MEQTQIFEDLKDTLDELIQLLLTFDQKDFNTIPFEGSWTAGELSQHLVKSIGGFVELINGPVKDPDSGKKSLIDRIKSDFLNFSVKFDTSDLIRPEKQHYEKDVQIGALSWLKQRILQTNTLDPSMQCTLFEIPVYGAFTRLEALALVLYHTQRHIKQLQNIAVKIEEKNKISV